MWSEKEAINHIMCVIMASPLTNIMTTLMILQTNSMWSLQKQKYYLLSKHVSKILEEVSANYSNWQLLVLDNSDQ